MIPVCCPRCGKRLLFVSPDTRGTLTVFCKRCRTEQTIALKTITT